MEKALFGAVNRKHIRVFHIFYSDVCDSRQSNQSKGKHLHLQTNGFEQIKQTSAAALEVHIGAAFESFLAASCVLDSEISVKDVEETSASLDFNIQQTKQTQLTIMVSLYLNKLSSNSEYQLS